MEAGRELDALISERVMDYNRHQWSALYGTEKTDYCLKCGSTKTRGKALDAEKDFCKTVPLHYSTDIDAAWLVVEKMISAGWSYDLTDGTQPQPQHDCSFYKETKEQPRFFDIADTAPLAICRAALKAIEEKEMKR